MSIWKWLFNVADDPEPVVVEEPKVSTKVVSDNRVANLKPKKKTPAKKAVVNKSKKKVR